MQDGYDIIGDVHGCGDELEQLLVALGYSDDAGHFAHPNRQVIFVGDLIDRGPAQVKAVGIARSMVEAGAALIVAANHEFNAIAYATPADDRPSGWLRNHDTKTDQHQTFLDQVGFGSAAYREMIAWFTTLPLWLDLDGLRVVHACWDAERIAWLASEWGPTPMGDETFMRRATDKANQTPEYVAIEHILKGPEIPIDPPYVDRTGTTRHEARMNWWGATLDADGLGRLGDLAHLGGGVLDADGTPYRGLADPDQRVALPVAAYPGDKPVFFGHYWMSGQPVIERPTMACTDWSAVKGGRLAAYRWSGETELSDDNWVSVDGLQR